MKHDKARPGSIGILMGAVIAILALARGSLQTWLLLGVFIIWGLWIMAAFHLPRMRLAKRRKNRRRQKGKILTVTDTPGNPFQIPEAGNASAESLLLCHVNHRISAYLRSAYPDSTWEWVEKKPERLALLGGTGRIRVFGIPDFDHADVTLDRQANISCSLLKTVSLSAAGNDNGAEEKAPPNKQPVDPQVWYEVQGRNVLESLVADLNSRGHSCLTLHENGDACVEEDKKEVPKENLPGFPEKMYWTRLVQVLESNGLAAEIAPDGIRVSW